MSCRPVFAAAVVIAIGGGFGAGATRASAQGASADQPRFDVASVKPNTGEPGRALIDGRAFRRSGRATVTNMTLLQMIQVLFREHDPAMLIEGGPAWLNVDRFDIVAEADPGSDAAVPPGQPLPRMNALLRALLADRFNLRTHIEHRQMQIYALVPADRARPAAKLRPSKTIDCASAQNDPERRCGLRQIGPNRIVAMGITLDDLALTLSGIGRMIGLDRPVENRTGIEGRFDVDARNDTLGAATGPGPAGQPIPILAAPEQGARLITMLKEQLGLALRSVPGERDVLVIDHAERPTPN